MMLYEYKTVPAPTRGLKARGVKSPEARFAHAVETAINAAAAEGWEYLRSDTLPHEERQGLTGSATTFRTLLIFRRALSAAAQGGEMQAGDAQASEAQATEAKASQAQAGQDEGLRREPSLGGAPRGEDAVPAPAVETPADAPAADGAAPTRDAARDDEVILPPRIYAATLEKKDDDDTPPRG
jgi:hypothetical protein